MATIGWRGFRQVDGGLWRVVRCRGRRVSLGAPWRSCPVFAGKACGLGRKASRTGCAPTRSSMLFSAMCRAAARAFVGPLCGGEGWTIRPRRGARQGCRALFVRAGARSKSPAAPHGLAGQSPPSAARGALLFGYFLLGKQEKVTRAAAAVRKPAAGEPVRRNANGKVNLLRPDNECGDRGERPSRTGCAPTGERYAMRKWTGPRQRSGSPRQASPVAVASMGRSTFFDPTTNVATEAKGHRAQGALLQGNATR